MIYLHLQTFSFQYCFADDINSLYSSHNNISSLFKTVNNELKIMHGLYIDCKQNITQYI